MAADIDIYIDFLYLSPSFVRFGVSSENGSFDGRRKTEGKKEKERGRGRERKSESREKSDEERVRMNVTPAERRGFVAKTTSCILFSRGSSPLVHPRRLFSRFRSSSRPLQVVSSRPWNT